VRVKRMFAEHGRVHSPPEQPASQDPLHRCAWKPTLSRGHDFEEEQLRWRRDVRHSTLGGLRAIDDQSVLGCQGDEPPLPRGKVCGIKHPITDIVDLVLLPIIVE
jgi:hypothetical protein